MCACLFTFGGWRVHDNARKLSGAHRFESSLFTNMIFFQILSLSPNSSFSLNSPPFWGLSIWVISVHSYNFVNKFSEISSHLSLSPKSPFSPHSSTFFGPSSQAISIYSYNFVNLLGEISSNLHYWQNLQRFTNLVKSVNIVKKFRLVCYFRYCVHI